MARLLNLEEMLDFYGREHFPIPGQRIRAIMHDEQNGGRTLGHLLRACNAYAAGQIDQAILYLEGLRRTTRTLDAPIIATLIWLYRISGQSQQAAFACLDYAEDAFAAKHHDSALEACSAALFLDQAADFKITRSPGVLRRIAGLYEQVARQMAPPPPPARTSTRQEPLRLALVTGNLVDYGVAYSRRTLQLASLADTGRFRVHVYSSENLTRREAPVFPFGLENDDSAKRAPETLRTLRERGIPVFLAPRDKHPVETAHILIRQLVDDQIDIALFQLGLASPIDWLVARLAPLPVKAGIHTGCSPFNTGFDCYFFDNPANLQRESAHWTSDMGERIHLNSGVDMDQTDSALPARRADLGIPADALVIGLLSNHLDQRLSVPYCEIIRHIMQRHSSAWFVAVGPPPPEELAARLFAGPGRDRVLFPGAVMNPANALKMFDLYAAEFPVGGSQSVKEAAACGIPIVALKWSDAHAESAAANIVGPDFAIPTPDPGAYAERLEHWLQNPSARRQAGQAMRQRAEKHYSFHAYAEKLFATLEDYHDSRTFRSPGAPPLISK